MSTCNKENMISVIIPLYNKEAIIERTLRSVLSQEFDDYEVIIVDDGSTDRSSEVVNSFKDKHIRYYKQENGGPSKARNTGIKHAKGKWLYFIDADDEMEPGVLKHFASLITKKPDTDMFIGEAFYNDGRNKILRNSYEDRSLRNVFKEFFYNKFYPCSGTVVYKKSLCINYLYNECIHRYEDLECLFRKFRDSKIYLTHYPASVVNIEYAEASHGRKDINEDFLGHIDFKGKSFWEKMCLYQFYLGERPLYREQCNKMYKTLRWRYDLLILTKLLRLIWH